MRREKNLTDNKTMRKSKLLLTCLHNVREFELIDENVGFSEENPQNGRALLEPRATSNRRKYYMTIIQKNQMNLWFFTGIDLL